MAELLTINLMFNDSLRTAFQSLWANKLRSFLTLLGIVIGIYAVVTLLAIARGVQKQTTNLIEGFGPRLITVVPGESSAEGTVNFAAQFAPSTLRRDDVDHLKQHTTLLEPEINYLVFLGGSLRKGEVKIAAFPVGGTPGVGEFFRTKLIAGRNLTAQDLDQKQRVILLSQRVTEKLAAKLNGTVSLGTEEFTIVGIFEIEEQFDLGPEGSNLSIIPATVAAEINRSDQIHRIIAKARDASSVQDAKTEITKLLTQKHGTTDFTVLLPSDVLDTFNQITDNLTYMVVGIAAISLLVGGIGISNIMLVTTTERTREIGIRKAVGATEGAILLQFLIEAVLLTSIGAGLGLGLAAITSLVIERYSPLQPTINWEIISLSLLMGVVTGVIFGLFPAYRASRKNPVEALRFE